MQMAKFKTNNCLN